MVGEQKVKIQLYDRLWQEELNSKGLTNYLIQNHHF